MDFIEEFTGFISERVPTADEWAEDLAVALLSTTLGRKRLISTSIGNLRLNVWHIYIGPSGLGYKTVPMKEYVLTILSHMNEITGDDLILPSSFSYEGMVEYMSKHNKEGIIIRDEVSTLFKEPSTKTYSADAIEFMSQLYDGTIQKRYTRKAKLDHVSYCYVVFVGATTPYLYQVLDEEVFVQGLGNRILFDFWKGNLKKFNGDELFYDMEEELLREEKLKDYATKLCNLRKAKPTIFLPEPDAAQMLAEFKSKVEREAYRLYEKDTRSLLATYLARTSEMAIKLSGLKMASRLWDVIPQSQLSNLIFTAEDAEWAINKVKRHIENFKRLLSDWSKNSKEEEITTTRRQKMMVLEFINSMPYKMASQGEILSELGLRRDQKFYALISTLEEEGKIEKIVGKEEIEKLPDEIKKKYCRGRGRYPIVYRLLMV